MAKKDSNELKATLLGLLTFVPPFYIVSFYILVTLLQGAGRQLPDSSASVLFAMHLAVVLLSLGLVFRYFVLVLNSKDIKDSEKPVWVISIFFCNIAIMPVIWYQYVWKPLQIKNDSEIE